jgi:flavin-dependent dehydrogenase
LPVLCLDGGYGGMVLADGGVTTLACCVRRDRLDALRAAQPGVRAGEAVEAWLRRTCPGVERALSAARREQPWLAVGPIDPGVRLSAGDTCFRIGNAAGEAHPILGEGMSMALQSAALFCTLLLRAPPGTSARSAPWQRAVARRYALQWRRQFAPRLRLAALFAHAAMRPAGSAALCMLLRAYPGLFAHAARWGGKTRCAVDTGTLEASAALRRPIPES